MTDGQSINASNERYTGGHYTNDHYSDGHYSDQRQRPGYALVFFARGTHSLVSWAVRCFTLSNVTHCSVAYDGLVIDPVVQGNLPYPVIPYSLEHPNLVGCFTVPVHAPIDLRDVPLFRRKPWLASVVRWLSLGLFPPEGCDDCVCTVSDILRHGGVGVPRRIVSPRGLFRWLENHEYPRFAYEPFE